MNRLKTTQKKKAPSRSFKTLRLLGILTGLMLAAACLSGCDSEAVPPQKESPRPVKTITVTLGESDFRSSYPGLVKASREVDLSFRVTGLLVKLPVKAGQWIKKGQLVAQLDQRDYRLRVARTKAAFEEARTQFQRYKRLINSKAISKSALDTQQSIYLTTKAAYEESLAALADTYLKAPFGGVVSRTLVENHQEISDKQTIVTLQDISKLEVEVQIPEKDMIMAHSYNLPELFVSFDALPGQEFPARLNENSTQADPNTQTFALTVVLPRPPGINALPGMTAELRVSASKAKAEAPAAIKIPLEAVLANGAKRSAVWVVDAETNAVRLVLVELGELSGGSVGVTSGLQEGDIVVVAGVHFLREGMKVRALNRAGQGTLQ